MDVNALEARLLDGFQHDFPLLERPYAALAAACDCSEGEVLDTLRRLSARGAVSRVGPVFGINRIGASTLAAMALAEADLQRVAAIVNDCREVNHNYAREHRFNLWFVAAAADRAALDATLARIEARSGYAVMDLPMLRDHHIDLGFSLGKDPHRRADDRPNHPRASPSAAAPRRQPGRIPAALVEALIGAIQDGLPLQPRPYACVARQIGCAEGEVLDAIAALRADGRIRRFGVVVRHRALGWRANAMVVWDVPDARVDELGERLGRAAPVTLCYQRPRRPPDWPYNLFSMVHGRDRDAVHAQVDELALRAGAAGLPRELLFSSRCFKQRGARYRG